MARIGNDKKIENRNKILEASKALFLTKGYENTSTSEIAKTVGMAEGTIFNYFKTKADIFLEVISEDFITVTEEEISSIDFTAGIVDVLLIFIEKTMGKLVILPKFVLVELGIAVMNTAKSKPGLIKKLAELDFKFMDQTYEIIEDFKKRKVIKPCDSRVFSEIIYGIVMFEVMMYVYEKERNLETMKIGMREKLEFVFKGYI